MKECTHPDGHLWSDLQENILGGVSPGDVTTMGDLRSVLVHCTRYGCDEVGYRVWSE